MIPVYLYNDIIDIVFSNTPPIPAYHINYPGVRKRSFCIRTKEGMIICCKCLKKNINPLSEYLIVTNEGKEVIGRLSEANDKKDILVATTEELIPLSSIPREQVFEISARLTEEELTALINETASR